MIKLRVFLITKIILYLTHVLREGWVEVLAFQNRIFYFVVFLQ